MAATTRKTTITAITLTILLTLAAGACSKKIYVPVERTRTETDSVATHRTDTLTHHLHTADTLLLRDSIITMVRGDTIYKETWRIRDRVRLLRDTVRIAGGFILTENHRDTIREPQIIETEKRVEIPAPLPWYRRALQWTGAAALLLSLLWLALRTYLRRQIPRT